MMRDRMMSVKKNPAELNDIYIVGRLIGLGNYGEVRKVEHKASKMYRALKIISKRFLPPDKLKRIYYEIELLRKLDHPNVIKIYEYFEDSEKICLILELC